MTAQSIHPRRPGRAARIARAEAAYRRRIAARRRGGRRQRVFHRADRDRVLGGEAPGGAADGAAAGHRGFAGHPGVSAPPAGKGRLAAGQAAAHRGVLVPDRRGAAPCPGRGRPAGAAHAGNPPPAAKRRGAAGLSHQNGGGQRPAPPCPACGAAPGPAGGHSGPAGGGGAVRGGQHYPQYRYPTGEGRWQEAVDWSLPVEKAVAAEELPALLRQKLPKAVKVRVGRFNGKSRCLYL